MRTYAKLIRIVFITSTIAGVPACSDGGSGHGGGGSPCDAYLACMQTLADEGGQAGASYQAALSAAQAQYGAGGSCGLSSSLQAACDASCTQALASARQAYPSACGSASGSSSTTGTSKDTTGGSLVPLPTFGVVDTEGKVPDESFVDDGLGSQGSSPGQPTASVGGACASDTDCGGGTCATSWPGGTCVVANCTATSCPGGSQCVDTGSGTFCIESCAGDGDCRSGYVCGAPGVCVPSCLDPGQTCPSGYSCGSDGFCAQAGSCMSPGGACSLSSECCSGSCTIGLGCN